MGAEGVETQWVSSEEDLSKSEFGIRCLHTWSEVTYDGTEVYNMVVI